MGEKNAVIIVFHNETADGTTVAGIFAGHAWQMRYRSKGLRNVKTIVGWKVL